MTTAIGVVIPVHGDIQPVVPLLDGLRGDDHETEGRPGRIIVVDDASPIPVDPAALPDGVKLIRRDINGGFGAAVNTGLRALAESPGITQALVLNSDLQIPAGFVQDALVRSAPWQPAVVGFRQVDEQGRSAWAARYFPTVSHQVIEWLVPLASQRHRPLLHRAVGHDVVAERTRTGLVPVDWVSGAALLLPLQEVLAAGGFDEGYFMYTEEVDLQLRLRRRGIPSVFDTELTVVHQGGGSADSEGRRRRWLVGARMRYARRHLSRPALRTGLTAATAVNLVWNTGRRLAGRDVEPLAVAREEMGLIWTAGRELPR